MRSRLLLRTLLLFALLAPLCRAPARAAEPDIAATVNGQAITNIDVENRARLFAIATGLPVAPAVLHRLAPQILRQLIDEKLQLQEMARRQVAVPDRAIAAAIARIEHSSGLPPGALLAKLRSLGVAPETLIDQIRVQLGWAQVVRETLGPRAIPAPADVARAMAQVKAEVGRTEYDVGEIFIPIDNPARTQAATRFADTVITQLRAGAPFGLVAAQFSQSQTGLHGGALGWLRPSQLDPPVAALVRQMPVGAITNPVPVAGGLSIVQLRGKRVIGNDPGTALSIRQIFFPFPTLFNGQNPTPAQRGAILHARDVALSVHSCPAMEQAALAAHSPRPANPGPVRLETVQPPPLRQLLATLPVDQASKPLVAPDGVAVIMVCSRRHKNFGMPSPQSLRRQIFLKRMELGSQQLLATLRAEAAIRIIRPGGA